MAESDSASEKTEEPTPRTLEKARERGEVAISTEFTAAALLAGALGLVLAYLDPMSLALRRAMTSTLTRALGGELDDGRLLSIAGDAVSAGLLAVLPVFVVVLVLGVVIPFLQVGPLFSPKGLTPDFKKLNPSKNLKQTFLSKDAYFRLFKTLMKVVVITWIAWATLRARLVEIVRLGTQPLPTLTQTASGVLSSLLVRVVMLLLALGALDLIYQKYKFLRDHRLSKKELKDEMKESEGDPKHAAKRKQARDEMMRERSLMEVRRAHAVIVNPTHIACAISYDPDKENAPRLVAKGEGEMAERIKQIAEEEDIPIVRDVSLARALYELEVDTLIPEDLYEAAAELLRLVTLIAQTHGKIPPWAKPPEADAAAAGEAASPPDASPGSA